MEIGTTDWREINRAADFIMGRIESFTTRHAAPEMPTPAASAEVEGGSMEETPRKSQDVSKTEDFGVFDTFDWD